jgi:hypothetical protein
LADLTINEAHIAILDVAKRASLGIAEVRARG